MEDITIQGKNQNYFSNTEDLLESGREINVLDCDNKNRVYLIGQDIINKYFKTESLIDKEIIINVISYTVVGTLQKSDGYSMGSNDRAVIIPYTTAMGLLGVKDISSVDVFMHNGELAETTTADIEIALNSTFNSNSDGYTLSNMQSILDKVAEMTKMLTLMLVSVTERTTEIGLRKALGAKPKTIQQQFLLESIFLSVLGGFAGVLLGIIMAYIGCLAIGTSFNLSIFTILLAVGFSAVLGIAFGFAPVRNASKLNPIDALRSV